MTTIGTAVLQIIPSLDGVSKSIDKQIDGTFRVAGQRGGKQLAKGVGDGLKDLERDVESTGRAYQKLRDRASDALGKVRADEAALTKLRSSGASDDRIIRAEERLAKSRRDSGRASRDAEDGHRSLAAAQSALASSSGNLGSNLTGLAGVASRVGPALATVGAAAAGAAIAGIALLAAGAVKATSELYQLGASFDETFDSLRIKTGATGPQLQALEDATKRISSGVPLAIGDIGAVVGETSRALHLTGTDLDNVSKNIANLGRLTGESVDVRTLGKAFRGFGVDAKDQVPALDSLFRASQSTGVGVNELLATVVKGGAGLRQFGFDFGQSAALATQFEESGLDADKAMAGLTKGLASLAKDGQTGQQALKDNVTQIKNLIATGDEAGALDLTNKLFGARGGVQFFEAIRNGALDLDTLSSALSGTGDTIQAAAADTDDFAEKWQEFKNQAAVALEPLATGLFDSINTELTGLTTWITAHQGEIIDFFEGLGSIVITSAEHVARGAGGMLQALGDLVGGIGNVKGVLDNAMAFFADLRGDHAAADEFRRSAQEAFGWGESIRAAGDKLANLNLGAARNNLSGWADSARDAATDAQNAAGKVSGLGTALGALPNNKSISVNADTAPAEQTMQAWWAKWKSVIAAAPGQGDDTDRPVIHATDKPPAPGGGPAPVPSLLDPNRPPLGGGRATGGPIFGAGSATSDSIPAWLSNGEHVLTAKDVQALGGQTGVYALRQALHRQGGGPIFPMAILDAPRDPRRNAERSRPSQFPDRGPEGKIRYKGPFNYGGDRPGMSLWPGGEGSSVGLPPAWWWPTDKGLIHWPSEPKIPLDPWIWNRKGVSGLGAGLGFAEGGAVERAESLAASLDGLSYIYGSRDCSKVQSDVYAALTGKPTGPRYFTTESDFESLGFVPGYAAGAYNIGVSRGGGGKLSHMAGTLPNGVHFEAGGSGSTVKYGGAARGAEDFPLQFYLPVTGGDPSGGVTGGNAASPFAGGSAVAAMTGGGGSAASSAPSSGGGGSSGGGSISLPSSLSGFGAFAGEQIGKQLGDEKLGKLTSAAGSLIDGQVESALDVFGVPSSPGWLQGVTKLIGGISIGGGDGAALPLAASPSGTGTPPPDDPGNMHGSRAGQQPGPVYNITARDTEDAFVKAQRVEREKAAAKLSRF